jgi:hypothetical protein
MVHDLQPISAAIVAQLAATKESGGFTMTTSKNPEQGETRKQRSTHEPAELDARYGEIGISAVAAALPYTDSKTPPRKETEVRIDQRFIEVAA